MAGTFRSYFLGQCTAYVAQLLSWVPPGLGNAYQWLVNAESQGYQTTTNLADVPPGAIAVYSSSLPGSGGDGHVAVVTSTNPGAGTFDVTEENFTYPTPAGSSDGTPDTRTSSMQYVTGFILPPSGASAFNGSAFLTSADASGGATTASGATSGALSLSPGLKTGFADVAAVLGGLTVLLVGIVVAVRPHLPQTTPVPVPV